MSAAFADTFYWIALADFADRFHRRALTIAARHGISLIATTDEVLTEFLTFFANAHESMRREVAANVREVLRNHRAARVLKASDSEHILRQLPLEQQWQIPVHHEGAQHAPCGGGLAYGAHLLHGAGKLRVTEIQQNIPMRR